MRNIAILPHFFITFGATAHVATAQICELDNLFSVPYRITEPLSVSSAFQLIAGDLDGDGQDDLITLLQPVSQQFVTHLSRGDGLFVGPFEHTTSSRVTSISTCDLDRDGTLDLFYADQSTDSFAYRLGSGDGRFADEVRVTVPFEPLSIVSGDFDGDNDTDFACTFSEQNGIGILANDGNGIFTLTGILEPTLDTRFLGSMDFNGDGIDDLAVAGEFAAHVLLSNGAGFAPATTIPISIETGLVSFHDFNCDGFTDLAITGLGTSILTGNGLGQFGSESTVATTPFSATDFGDVTDDGCPDIINSDFGSLTLFVNQGDGSFIPTTSSTTESRRPLALGDFDQDEKLDLAIPRQNGFPPVGFVGDGIDIRRGNNTGCFTEPIPELFTEHVNAIHIDDLNDDGFPDMMIGLDETNELIIRYGDASGGFASETRLTADRSPLTLATGDVNNDGTIDIVTPLYNLFRGSSIQSRTYLNSGDGSFTAADSSIGVPIGVRLALCHIDGDPFLDLISTGSLIVPSIIAFGSGDGGFEDPIQIESNDAAANSIDVGDANGDGFADYITNGRNFFNVPIIDLYLGTGPRTFSKTPIEVFTLSGTFDARFADINADGHLDIVTDRNAALGDSTGSFTHSHFFQAEREGFVSIADLNNDGFDDATFFVNIPTNPIIQYALSNGDGSFEDLRTITISTDQYARTLGDLNADGAIDFLTATRDFGTGQFISTHINVCPTDAPCPADCDNSGTVNFSDLVAILAQFGGNSPACDADDSGTVNFSDLVSTLSLFGPCPNE